MATRWEVTAAVRKSDLPAPARLIIFVLADVADNDTAVVPAGRTLSLSELAQQTGLSRRAVAEHLSILDRAGWVERDKPEDTARARAGEKTKYRLKIGGSAGGALVQEVHHRGSAGGAPEVVQEVHRGSAPGALKRKNPSTTPQEPSKPFLSAASRRRRGDDKPVRFDVEQICRHLADRIEANGSKRPTVTAKWRAEARLLLDKDGRTVEQVIRAIDWCQADAFWRSNVLSMPKLREKYDQLRLAAQRKRESGGRATGANRFHNDPARNDNPFAGGANATVASQTTGSGA